jgi:hypothetical protein
MGPSRMKPHMISKFINMSIYVCGVVLLLLLLVVVLVVRLFCTKVRATCAVYFGRSFHDVHAAYVFVVFFLTRRTRVRPYPQIRTKFV